MRLPAALCALAGVGSLVASVGAEPSLPSRAFPASSGFLEPSVPLTPSVGRTGADWWGSGGPRVRPVEKRLAEILATGLQRSALLRALVDKVNASDVVVYIGLDPAMWRGLAGRVTFAGEGGKYRYLRAMLNPDLATDLLIASLAHELQHVIEVIEHPEVRSEGDLENLYRRIGTATRVGGRPGWDTDAAQQTTLDVRRQLSSAAS